ncbi:MAG: gamma carbonic anhydrase family protein [Acidimicrobiales bacterium]|nr:MAG: gamma carbonic anhydrase family protein [Acidimicrobiales bacterium]
MPIYALGEREPRIHPDAYVHPDAVVIGDVRIGAGASIWPCAVLRGDDGTIFVGERTSVQDGSVIHCTVVHDTVIGADCVIGHMVHLEGCVIEDGALVGNGAVVLHDAVVRTRSLVGSNAVVPGRMEVPTGTMALGVPARIVERDPGEFGAYVQSYLARAERYRRELRRLG